MIAHIILFRPRPDLADTDRRNLLQEVAAAAVKIPSVRTFKVGRRVTHGRPGYEQMMVEPYDYAAVVEFDDVAGLEAYLSHPAHEQIGKHFLASAAAALAYDYELTDARNAATLQP